MNEIGKKLRQGYESTELPEELRLRAREGFLAAAETRAERSITMSKKMKRPVAAAVIAAAALTVSITAGAAVSGIFHKESIDNRLGEGAADTVMSQVDFQSVSVENEYLRITADAVFCDGNTASVFLTKERLAEPPLGWDHYELGSRTENLIVEAAYADDGSMVDNVAEYYTFRNNDGVSERVAYEVCELNNIEAGRAIVLTFHPDCNRPDTEVVKGLSLTIETTQNFSPITFADDKGRELDLTPYRLYTNGPDINIIPYDLTLINSKTGARKTFRLVDGAGFGDYTTFNYKELIPEIEQYDTLEIEKFGTFYKK